MFPGGSNRLGSFCNPACTVFFVCEFSPLTFRVIIDTWKSVNCLFVHYFRVLFNILFIPGHPSVGLDFKASCNISWSGGLVLSEKILTLRQQRRESFAGSSILS